MYYKVVPTWELTDFGKKWVKIILSSLAIALIMGLAWITMPADGYTKEQYETALNRTREVCAQSEMLKLSEYSLDQLEQETKAAVTTQECARSKRTLIYIAGECDDCFSFSGIRGHNAKSLVREIEDE